MHKNLSDIDIDKIDLNLHKMTMQAGTIFYRVVDDGIDPVIPSGLYSRFSSQPSQYPGPKEFASLYENGQAIGVGTASTCVTYKVHVALQESDAKNKVLWKLTLKTSIDAIDMDSICAAEGVPKPYINEDREGIWKKFYGKHIKALRYESFEDKNEYNAVMFPDWIEDFQNTFLKERVDPANAK
ncbi:MAG: hypothetical protein HYZ85_00375 [Candidatus Omnitrophica bacterium]|nr:hypothetical protein [Candidatus Omnitrophota bacterium]